MYVFNRTTLLYPFVITHVMLCIYLLTILLPISCDVTNWQAVYRKRHLIFDTGEHIFISKQLDIFVMKGYKT